MFLNHFSGVPQLRSCSGRSAQVPVSFVAVLGLAVAVAGGLTGCFSPGSAVQQGINSATSAAGEQVGKAIGAEIASAADLPPPGSAQYNQFMVSQAQVLFSHAFSAGGMWPAEATYESGEWAAYERRASGQDTALDTLERAFLTTTDDGNEWWRVRGTQDGEEWVYEGLLDPEQETVVRLRSRDPEGNVEEVPVTEETVYQPPQQLTEESVEGATVGTESVETAAGTFTARRVEYSGAAQGSTAIWFLSDEVPGHVVQYQVRQNEDEWTNALINHGTGATTELDSY